MTLRLGLPAEITVSSCEMPQTRPPRPASLEERRKRKCRWQSLHGAPLSNSWNLSTALVASHSTPKRETEDLREAVLTACRHRSFLTVAIARRGFLFTLQFTAVFATLATDAVKASGSPSRTDAADGTIVYSNTFGSGAVAELILPVRHSPGMTRREATRDTSETGCSGPKWQRPRSFVLRSIAAAILSRNVPARCIEENCAPFGSRLSLRFETPRNSCKARAFSVLLMVDRCGCKGPDDGIAGQQILFRADTDSCQVGKNNRET